MTDFATHRWRDPVWLAEAARWATERLTEHGYGVTGEPEQTHVRPWSTVLRLATADGVSGSRPTRSARPTRPR